MDNTNTPLPNTNTQQPPAMWCGIVSLFPEMFSALDSGITGRAQRQQLMQLAYFNPRDFTRDKHHTVDDRPYGGGPGMVMQPQPLFDAINAAKKCAKQTTKVVYLAPCGKRLEQKMLKSLLSQQRLVLVAGRYEGIDHRLIEAGVIDECLSIGDYVLSGGELATMVLIDALCRLIPGALGHDESASQDSFSNGLLEHPHYTRPAEFMGLSVPEVLLNGDHQAIAEWRLQQALGTTWLQRPDLLAALELTPQQQALLEQFIQHYLMQSGADRQ